MKNVYLDFSATTPIDPDVLESMMPYFSEDFGNPSSIHKHGQTAERAIEDSRETIARIMGCAPAEIIFTSGGTEANNLAIRGTAFEQKLTRNATKILTTPVEHEAVTKTVNQLQSLHGFEVNLIPVDNTGKVLLDEFAEMLGPDVAIVSTIFGNNEIGTINPVEKIATLCSEYQIPFHTDAVQALGYIKKISLNNITMLSAGAHKFYGPKGVGFLYKQKLHKVFATNTGGSQENNIRAGTHNVPYIVGMAAALEKTRLNYSVYANHYTWMRDMIISGVTTIIPGAKVTGSVGDRLCNHASFVLNGVDGNELVIALDVLGYSCSSGSACKTGNPEPSGVLLAIGLTPSDAKGSLRISVGRSTTEEEVVGFLKALSQIVPRLEK